MKWPLTIRSATLLMTPPQGIPPKLVYCIREPDLHMGAWGQSGSAMRVVNQAKHGKSANNKASQTMFCRKLFSCIDLYFCIECIHLHIRGIPFLHSLHRWHYLCTSSHSRVHLQHCAKWSWFILAHAMTLLKGTHLVLSTGIIRKNSDLEIVIWRIF